MREPRLNREGHGHLQASGPETDAEAPGRWSQAPGSPPDQGPS